LAVFAIYQLFVKRKRHNSDDQTSKKEDL
jgi:hypothetical protein